MDAQEVNIPLGRISEDKLMDTIHNLSLATDRLEQYANQVREIQAMDAIPVKPTTCPLREFFEEQEDEYTVLAHQHQLQFSMDTVSYTHLDVYKRQPII